MTTMLRFCLAVLVVLCATTCCVSANGWYRGLGGGFAAGRASTYGSTLLGNAVTDSNAGTYAQGGNALATADGRIRAGPNGSLRSRTEASAFVPSSGSSYGNGFSYQYGACPPGAPGCIQYGFNYGAAYSPPPGADRYNLWYG